MAWQLASLWNRGLRQLPNGPLAYFAYTCSTKNIHAMFFSFTHYQFFTLSDRHFCAVNSLLKFVSRRPVSLFVLFSHRCSWTSRSRDRQVTGESSGIEYSCTAINWFKRPTAKKFFPKLRSQSLWCSGEVKSRRAEGAGFDSYRTLFFLLSFFSVFFLCCCFL